MADGSTPHPDQDQEKQRDTTPPSGDPGTAATEKPVPANADADPEHQRGSDAKPSSGGGN